MKSSVKRGHSNKSCRQYFPVVLFIRLKKVVLNFRLWMKSLSVNIHIKATEQYVSVVLFQIVQYKVVLIFGSADEIIRATFK